MASLRSALAGWTWLEWAALPVTDRRWTAPLAATAVGMGLFIGVAIGPGIGRTVGAAQQLVLVPATDQPGGGRAEAALDPPPALGSPVAGPPSPPSRVNRTPLAPSVPLATSTPPPPAPAADDPATESAPEEPAASTEAEQPEEPLSFKGTVMHVNEAAGSYVLATAKGQMNAIHAKRLPDPSTKLEVAVRELANGTYAEDGERVGHGSAGQAEFEGVVTFADPATGAYSVSRKGASVFVHPPAGDPPAPPPAVGADVDVTAALGPPAPPSADVGVPPPDAADPAAPPPAGPPQAEPADCGTAPEPPEEPTSVLTEVSREVKIEFLGYSDFEGIVQGFCPSTRELIISADDLRESAADLRLTVAAGAGIDLAEVKPGDVVDASGVIDEDGGPLSLTGLSSDAGIRSADDAELAQGDQAR